MTVDEHNLKRVNILARLPVCVRSSTYWYTQDNCSKCIITQKYDTDENYVGLFNLPNTPCVR